jgi:hypothetical protein
MVLDQNTTVLLSTLLGGLLTLGGGFIANFYIQSASTKNDKQKSIRNMIEQIYKDTKKIEDLYEEYRQVLYQYEITTSIERIDEYTASSLNKKLEEDLEEKRRLIKTNLDHIELLVTLYLPSLAQSFSTYQNKISAFIGKLRSHLTSEDLSEEKLEEISKRVRSSLLPVSKKKGYRYF